MGAEGEERTPQRDSADWRVLLKQGPTFQWQMLERCHCAAAPHSEAKTQCVVKTGANTKRGKEGLLDQHGQCPRGWATGREKGWSKARGREGKEQKLWRRLSAPPGRLLTMRNVAYGTDLWSECTLISASIKRKLCFRVSTGPFSSVQTQHNSLNLFWKLE